MESPLGKEFISKRRGVESYEQQAGKDMDMDKDQQRDSRLTSFTNPLHSLKHLTTREGDKASQTELQQELDSLYALLVKDPLYTSLDHVEEALLVVSTQEPHLILHCSSSLETLVGASAQEIFGTSLASLTAIVTNDYLDRRSVVPEFLRTMRAHGGRRHTLVHLVHRSPPTGMVDSYQECSVTAFPIHQGATLPSVQEAHIDSDSDSSSDCISSVADNTTVSGLEHSRSSHATTTSHGLSSRGSSSLTQQMDETVTVNYFGLLVAPIRSKRTTINHNL